MKRFDTIDNEYILGLFKMIMENYPNHYVELIHIFNSFPETPHAVGRYLNYDSTELNKIKDKYKDKLEKYELKII
jgi:hypothetical protein